MSDSERRTDKTIHPVEYQALAEFRYHIRRYLEFSDSAARSAGLEPRQYQLLLAVKGLAIRIDPTIGNLAENLQIRHHSAVELVNRAEANGLVKRRRTGANRSFVFVSLTKKGEDLLGRAVATRLDEMRVAGPILVDALRRILKTDQ
jgi:DNA-binding MarR family transcriptional regulator